MKIQTKNKLILAVPVFLMAASQLNLVQAADYPYSSQAAQPRYNPNYQNYPPQNTPYYGSTDNLTPGYTQPYYGGRNYRRGSNVSPWGGSGPNFSGPWDGGRGGNSMPWNSGRDGNGPSFSGPWDGGSGWRSKPWDSGRGGRSMPWNDNGRGGWMNKDKFGDAWDDMLNAPSDMGEMPGGWTAPSVSVPNPVDVGDEFGDASRDVPDQMRNVYDDNRRSK